MSLFRQRGKTERYRVDAVSFVVGTRVALRLKDVAEVTVTASASDLHLFGPIPF